MGQANHALATDSPAERRLACRERDEFRPQLQPANGREIEPPIGHDDVRALRTPIADPRVRREMQEPVLTGITRQPALHSCPSADQHVGAVPLEHPADGAGLLRCIRKRR